MANESSESLNSLVAKRDAYYDAALTKLIQYPADSEIETNLQKAVKYNLEILLIDKNKEFALKPEIQKVFDLVSEPSTYQHENDEVMKLAKDKLLQAHYSSLVDHNLDAAFNAIKKGWPDELATSYLSEARKAHNLLEIQVAQNGAMHNDPLKDAALKTLSPKDSPTLPEESIKNTLLFLKKELSAEKPQAMSLSPRDINVALAALQNERAA